MLSPPPPKDQLNTNETYIVQVTRGPRDVVIAAESADHQPE